MADYIGKCESPRHKFVYYEVPTYKGSMYGGSIRAYDWHDYGQILDSCYEMAGDVADANGVAYEAALETVLKDENWHVLPKHRRQIVERLRQE